MLSVNAYIHVALHSLLRLKLVFTGHAGIVILSEKPLVNQATKLIPIPMPVEALYRWRARKSKSICVIVTSVLLKEEVAKKLHESMDLSKLAK